LRTSLSARAVDVRTKSVATPNHASTLRMAPIVLVRSVNWKRYDGVITR
jgi:hypothetical protein